MYKPTYLEMSHGEKLTQYATSAEKKIDVVFDKVVKITWASCTDNMQAYSDRLEALYDECASTNLIFSTRMKEAKFRRGHLERLRMEAAIIQTSDLYISSPSPSSFIIAALQDIKLRCQNRSPPFQRNKRHHHLKRFRQQLSARPEETMALQFNLLNPRNISLCRWLLQLSTLRRMDL